jgi:hypothetical protein
MIAAEITALIATPVPQRRFAGASMDAVREKISGASRGGSLTFRNNSVMLSFSAKT